MSVEENQTTIATFLLQRLKEIGCDHIFGVPGDFVLGLFNQLLKSDVKYVGTCNELNAAYAADAYARLKGIGCVSTTFVVGELSAVNGLAGSFAEKIPVIKLTGVPATRFYHNQPLLHHTVGDYEAPVKMYEKVTVAQTILSNPDTAASEIDRVLRACLRESKPVYIGIPSDMVLQAITVPVKPFKFPSVPQSDPWALKEAVSEAAALINKSKLPLILPGMLISRRKLQNEVQNLIDASGIPFATMMLSKALFNEAQKQFIGLYCGDRSRQVVRERVEGSDCLIMLGELLTDFNTGGFSAVLDRRSTIELGEDFVKIMFHTYTNVYLKDFIIELTKVINDRSTEDLKYQAAVGQCVHCSGKEYTPEPQAQLTMARFFDRMTHYFEPNSIIIAETGAAMFSAAETRLPEGATYISQTFYGSIGYTVGATLGACIAAPDRKVYLLIGDGSFQVTCQDLSTMIRYNCNPLIVLINNDGYTIERVIVDRIYNDIQPWTYHMLPKVFGGSDGFDVKTEGELETALATCLTKKDLSFIEIHLDRWDCNDALREAGKMMAKNNRLLDDSVITEPVLEQQRSDNLSYIHTTSVYPRMQE